MAVYDYDLTSCFPNIAKDLIVGVIYGGLDIVKVICYTITMEVHNE